MCKIVMVSRNAGKTEQQIFSELNTRLEHLIEEQRLKLGQKAAAASSLITKSDRTRMKDVVSTFITYVLRSQLSLTLIHLQFID